MSPGRDRPALGADGGAMLYVAVFAGLRSSEIRGLPRSAIDFKAEMLTIS